MGVCERERWVHWWVGTDNLFFCFLFFHIHVTSCLDSQLRGDLLALTQNFSNFTVSTESQVKALSSQGEGAPGLGPGLGLRGG